VDGGFVNMVMVLLVPELRGLSWLANELSAFNKDCAP
jgi:hypothetical protein